MPAENFSLFPLANVTLRVGAATGLTYLFRSPVNCEIVRVDASAEEADGTDNFVVTVEVPDGTVAWTLAAVNADDTVVSATAPDSGDIAFVGVGQTVQVVLAYTGTAANVLGIVVTVWARSKR